MNKITLTLTFDTFDDLHAYLLASPEKASTKVASAQPSAEVVALTPPPIPAPAAPTVAPAPAAQTVAPAPAQVVDFAALKSSLMGRLRALSDSMDDPSPIAKFINNFGVARFSELPDDQLPRFEAALVAEFGAL